MLCQKECCFLQVKNTLILEPDEYIRDKANYIRAGICVIDKNNKILLSQSYNNYWGIPKGRVENKETLEEAAIREVYEETGLLFNLDNVTKRYFFLNGSTYVFFFLFLNCSIEYIPLRLTKESTGAGWVRLSCLDFFIRTKTLKVNKLCFLVLTYLKTGIKTGIKT